MIKTKEEWNTKFKNLKLLLNKPKENLNRIVDLSIELHAFTHESLNGNIQRTLEDQFWDMDRNTTTFSKSKMYSAAWHLWHSARIEDISCAYFFLNEKEIYDSSHYLNRLNIPFRHTGNSMNFQEMTLFNKKINLNELREYRKEVSIKTRLVLEQLTDEIIKRKVSQKSLTSISTAGSVADQDSWLLHYWGRKQLSGIITMPFTRHLLVHINSALRLH